MLVFIDETGDHNLEKIDPQYPLFGLGALMIREEQYVMLNAAVVSLKKEFFGDDGTFILHSSELKRPGGKRSDPRNLCMQNAVTRKELFEAFDRIVDACDFLIVSCFIRKEAMRQKYVYPADPYHLAFENLLNRILRYGDQEVELYAEQRGHELDIELRAEYERLARVGIRFFSARDVRERASLALVPKQANLQGLQVIDILLASLARSVLGKEYKMLGNDADPVHIRNKLACAPTFFP